MGIDIGIFSCPVSILVGTAFLLLVHTVHTYAGKSAIVRALSGKTASVLALSLISVIILIEGIWSNGIVHGSIFLVSVPVFLFCLGLAVLSGFKNKKALCPTLCHLGLFVIVWASFFGAPDVQRMKVALKEGGEPSDCAYNMDGSLAPLPMGISLKRFTTEYYPDGTSPKQYSSTMEIDGKIFQTSVNHPARYRGYTFFQEGYAGEHYSIIGISRDPWLPVVYLGMAILAAGALILLSGKWKLKILIPVAVLVAIVFTLVSVARISFGTLMPALRSLWFVPHLAVYMLAYSLMAIALVLSLVRPFVKGKDLSAPASVMVRISSSLLIIGMLCGAVWARQAWGDYWTWDPKECLAAVTWLISLVYLHIPQTRRKTLASVLAAAFIALQFTWYGVNYLPSAKNSLHTYNSQQP